MPTQSLQFQEYLTVLPECVMIAVALLVLILDLFVEKDRKFVLGWFSLAGVVGSAIATYQLAATGVIGLFFADTFHLDPFATFFKFVFYIACGLGILLSIN